VPWQFLQVAAVICSVILTGCGVGAYYLRPGETVVPDSLNQPTPGSKLVYHLSLIGDAGYAGSDNDAPIRAIAAGSDTIETTKLTAYLGDNIYGSGMPPSGDPDRDRA